MDSTSRSSSSSISTYLAGTLDNLSSDPLLGDYDSSLSKLKYGTFGSLEEGIPAVQEQSQTTTILDLDGTSTTGWQGDTSYLSIDGTDAFEWDGMTSNNQAYYEFPNGAVSGDLTLKAKMKLQVKFMTIESNIFS